jgi:hypothetical protein
VKDLDIVTDFLWKTSSLIHLSTKSKASSTNLKEDKHARQNDAT